MVLRLDDAYGVCLLEDGGFSIGLVDENTSMTDGHSPLEAFAEIASSSRFDFTVAYGVDSKHGLKAKPPNPKRHTLL